MKVKSLKKQALKSAIELHNNLLVHYEQEADFNYSDVPSKSFYASLIWREVFESLVKTYTGLSNKQLSRVVSKIDGVMCTVYYYSKGA